MGPSLVLLRGLPQQVCEDAEDEREGPRGAPSLLNRDTLLLQPSAGDSRTYSEQELRLGH